MGHRSSKGGSGDMGCGRVGGGGSCRVTRGAGCVGIRHEYPAANARQQLRNRGIGVWPASSLINYLGILASP